MSQLFALGSQSTGVLALASFLPKNTILQNGLVGSSCSPRDSQESSPTPEFKSINSSALSLLHSPTLTSIHDHRKNHITSFAGSHRVETPVVARSARPDINSGNFMSQYSIEQRDMIRFAPLQDVLLPTFQVTKLWMSINSQNKLVSERQAYTDFLLTINYFLQFYSHGTQNKNYLRKDV